METKQLESAQASDTQAIEEIQRLRELAQVGIPAPVPKLEFSDLMARVAAPNPERAERLEQLRIRQANQAIAISRRAALSGLETAAGSRYAQCRLENYHAYDDLQSRVLAAVREYIETLADRVAACEGIIFYGPVGTGKDHLAYAICHAALRSLETVGWVNAQNWFGKLRDNMDTGKSEGSAIAELGRPQLLCCSDPLPPVGNLTQHQTTMLYRLIDARYANGKPTIVTVNVKDDLEADERMGAATWDRLCHGAWKIQCNWPTHRQPSRVIT